MAGEEAVAAARLTLVDEDLGPRQDAAGSERGAVEWDRNDAGRATAMTLLTRLQGWGGPWLRTVMWYFRHFTTIKKLQRLSFLHFAHWSALDGLDPGDRNRLTGGRHQYMLFQANFNGTWHEYIEAFTQVVGGGIHAILASCEGFPGLAPVRGFYAFMENHEFAAEHYYSAYPDATATTIRAAQEMEREVRALEKAAASSHPDRFAAAWARALANPTFQANLAGQACELAGRRALVHKILFGRKNVAEKRCVFLALTPIRPGRAGAVRSYVEGLERGAQSPLARVERLHFGRWVVIDRVFHDSWPEKYEVLETPYLLFTGIFDIPPRRTPNRYLDELLAQLGDVREAIWGQCEGWPADCDVATQREWLLAHRRDVEFLFAGYAGRVADVRRAVGRRDRMVQFAGAAQGMVAGELRHAFRAAFSAGAYTEGGIR